MVILQKNIFRFRDILMKIIIYNYNEKLSVLNFFDVFESLPENEFRSKDELELPRVIGSNENFEQMTESEAKFEITRLVGRGFYKEDGLNICRYYNSKVYPQN